MPPALSRQTIGDLPRRTAARSPAKLAVACGAVQWTYAEFDAVCERVAAGLAQRGITKGDRVALLARNSHAFAAMRFALARLGAVLVPINFMLKADEAAYILRHAGARLLATDSDEGQHRLIQGVRVDQGRVSLDHASALELPDALEHRGRGKPYRSGHIGLRYPGVFLKKRHYCYINVVNHSVI